MIIYEYMNYIMIIIYMIIYEYMIQNHIFS